METIHKLLSTIFPGFPDVLGIDMESSFNTAEFRDLAEAKGTKLRFLGI